MCVASIQIWQLSHVLLLSNRASDRCFFIRTPKAPTLIKPTSDLKPNRLRRTCGFDFDPIILEKNGVLLGQRMMMVKASAWRSGGSDEEGIIQAFEQEPFTDTIPDGIESTLNRLSKWVIVVFFVGTILWRHDTESLWASTGFIINVMLSYTLKRMLNQERPLSTLRSDPGMPSSHAQSIFFMAVFAILSIVEWFEVNVLTVIFSGFVLALGSYISWLRVSQQMHTASQVAVGSLLGSGFSGLWYWLWCGFVLEAFDSILWVRITVILGAAGFCTAFLAYLFKRFWFRRGL